MKQRQLYGFLFTSFLPVFLIAQIAQAQIPLDRLHATLSPLAGIFTGERTSFNLHGDVTLPIDGQNQSVTFRLNRQDELGFDLELAHADYAIDIRWRPEAFAVILPRHQVVYLGTGSMPKTDNLNPKRFLARSLSSGTQAFNFLPLLNPKNTAGILELALSAAKLEFDEAGNHFRAGDKAQIRIQDNLKAFQVSADQVQVNVIVSDAEEFRSVSDFEGLRVVEVAREGLESQLARGVKRGAELLIPSPLLTNPLQKGKKVPHGELRWIDGQRVVLLSGTPEQVGTAHGQLLKDEAVRCVDSVLNVFGTLQMVRTGRLFQNDLHDASLRLLPHIPERHRVETRALAASLEMNPELVETLNVFPELFHCSGFAVFGAATLDGKLYHGRVLDYMTMIGLQDCATTFIVAVEDQIPFANIGYAAFIGSVSGMNAQTISLGEMGGRGEGNWDGVPMATLMRRALEECSTLDDVMNLWANNPRTCEYYYVFAEGKTRRAVGVAALPESIEFIHPGESHSRLGDGIPDAVILSAGSRLDALRARVQEKYGSIDAEAGQWLMCRPVAMKSNLHNVLFVPEDGEFYVANASHKLPAAERPYARFNLQQLLTQLPQE